MARNLSMIRGLSHTLGNFQGEETAVSMLWGRKMLGSRTSLEPEWLEWSDRGRVEGSGQRRSRAGPEGLVHHVREFGFILSNKQGSELI